MTVDHQGSPSRKYAFGAQAEHLPLQAIRAGDDFHFDAPDVQTTVKSLAGAALSGLRLLPARRVTPDRS